MQQRIPASAWCLRLLFNRPDTIIKFMSLIKVHHLVDPTHQFIFNRLADNYDPNTGRYSPLWKSHSEGFRDQHAVAVMNIATIDTPLDTDVEKIARMVRIEWQQDIIKRACLGALEGLENGEAPNSVIRKTKALFDACSLGDENLFRHISFAIDEVLAMVKERRDGVNDRIKTGFVLLDFLTGGGFKVGEFVVVASMTGQGKSFFVSQMIVQFVQNGKRVAIISLEMDDDEVFEKCNAVGERSSHIFQDQDDR